MKVFVAILAIAALAYADQGDDVAELKKYLDCTMKAMVEGVPSVPVPKHNPTKITDQVLKNKKGATKYEANITNAFLYNLMDVEFPVLNATRVNADRVVYDYEVSWKNFNISGDVQLFWKAPHIHINKTTTFSIIINKVRWSGVFDYTKPKPGVHGVVNKFTINSKSSSVDVEFDFDGAHPIETVVSEAIWQVFNHFPVAITEGFRTKRFNDFWLGHPERINAVLDVCGFAHIVEN